MKHARKIFVALLVAVFTFTSVLALHSSVHLANECTAEDSTYEMSMRVTYQYIRDALLLPIPWNYIPPGYMAVDDGFPVEMLLETPEGWLIFTYDGYLAVEGELQSQGAVHRTVEAWFADTPHANMVSGLIDVGMNGTWHYSRNLGHRIYFGILPAVSARVVTFTQVDPNVHRIFITFSGFVNYVVR